MKSKKFLSLLLAGTMILGSSVALSGCDKDDVKTDTTASATQATENEETPTATSQVTTTNKETPSDMKAYKPTLNPEIKKDTENTIGYQLEMPKAGDQIAVIHTTMGDITLQHPRFRIYGKLR
ncbi:MAG: hypothetical protein E7566_06750 [Ruminococcaceae bacterium]|nr:hypothetical protein [Oscillospiraceae bacterium]